MRLGALASALFAAAVLLAGCTSGSTGATPTPAASVAPTPSDHALMMFYEECVGLAEAKNCASAAKACAKAAELNRAAKVPEDDKWFKAVLEAQATCAK